MKKQIIILSFIIFATATLFAEDSSEQKKAKTTSVSLQQTQPSNKNAKSNATSTGANTESTGASGVSFVTSSGDTVLKVQENGVVLADSIAVSNTVTAGAFVGDGSGLTGIPTSADNLGNHTATQNIRLNGNYLSRDGGNEGIFIGNDGAVGIGDGAPNSRLSVRDSSRAAISLRNIANTNSTGLAFQNSGGSYSWNIYREANPGAAADLVIAGGNASTTVEGLTEQMRITRDGKIGIGTSAPAADLQVAGTIAADIFQIDSISITGTALVSTSDLLLDHGGAPSITRQITLRGVRQGVNDAFAQINFSNRDPNAADQDQTAARIASYNSNLTDSGDLRFYTLAEFDDVDGPLERMRITETGNVGIGTETPETPLAILGNEANRPVGITQNQVGGGATMEFTTTDNSGAQATRLMLTGNNDNTNIEFYRGARGSETQTMVIEGATGNVGIGTNSPVSTLDVGGGNISLNGGWLSGDGDDEGVWIDTDGKVSIGTNFSENALTVMGNSAGAGVNGGLMTMQNTSMAGFSGIYFNGATGNRKGWVGWVNGNAGGIVGPQTMQIGALGDSTIYIAMKPTTGNVGIGTASPSYKLEVNGSAGKPGGGFWATASDRRLKDVQGNFQRGLEALDGLQPIYYNYKNGNALSLPSRPQHVGLIAQEAQKVIPEAVEKDEDGYLSIDNEAILWTMLNAIKELKAEKDALKAQNAQLAKQNKAFEKRFAQIELALKKIGATSSDIQMTSAE